MSKMDTDAIAPERDSALAELRDDPASRKKFLKMLGGGAAVGTFGMVLAACGDDKEENGGSGGGSASNTTDTTNKAGGAMAGDLEILNYALTLEHLEADFYKKVIAANLFQGKNAEYLEVFGDHEAQHVDALTATIEKLGGKPAAAPKTKFPLEDAKSVLELAGTVENLGAAAYLGQAGRIKNKEVLAAALSIHTVEARHAAALNTLLKKPITPDGAFAKPASMEEVLPKVKPFIVS